MISFRMFKALVAGFILFGGSTVHAAVVLKGVTVGNVVVNELWAGNDAFVDSGKNIDLSVPVTIEPFDTSLGTLDQAIMHLPQVILSGSLDVRYTSTVDYIVDGGLAGEIEVAYQPFVSPYILSVPMNTHSCVALPMASGGCSVNGVFTRSFNYTFGPADALPTQLDVRVKLSPVNIGVAGGVVVNSVQYRATSRAEAYIEYRYTPHPPDTDGDGVADPSDNCPIVANPDQADVDGDGIGDACDNDNDNDGVLDVSDNCLTVPNPDQADNDGDLIGDDCDADDDTDGIEDDADNCQFIANADQTDTDGDGVGDACDHDADNDGVLNDADNCPLTPNTLQEDLDGDGLGDVCDDDVDGDGIANTDDNCPTLANADQANLDGDAFGDACDGDIDGDGIGNDIDNCPVIVNTDQQDTDLDGQGDACDSDDDNDGVADDGDNCPLVSNADQADADGDGVGNACDEDYTDDADGDGVSDSADNCPNTANPSQADFDGDGLGDACDDDADGDGVLNAGDLCPTTPISAVVLPENGCTLAQLCPCAGPFGSAEAWKNRGQYQNCVARTADSFLEAGLLTTSDRDSVVNQAAQSNCGR